MPTVPCPSCWARVPESSAGKRLKCAKCGERFDPDDEEDVDEDRPRKKKTAAKKSGPPVWIFAVAAGAVLLAITAVVVAVFVFKGKGGAGGLDPLGVLDSPPAGYTTVKDSAGGFRLYLPGQPRKGQININGRAVSDDERVGWRSFTGGFGQPQVDFTVNSARLPPNTQAGPDQLEQLLPLADSSYEGGKNHEVVSRTPVTLDGKPALEIRTREHPELRRNDKPPPPEEFAKRDHTVYYVTSTGTRVIVLSIRMKGPPADDQMLRTIRDSFKLI
jgi:hypothetical protein